MNTYNIQTVDRLHRLMEKEFSVEAENIRDAIRAVRSASPSKKWALRVAPPQESAPMHSLRFWDAEFIPQPLRGELGWRDR
jgi:hypothetical protein